MKKMIFLYIQAALFLSLAFSCKKGLRPEGTASFTIVNAMSGLNNGLINFNPNYLSTAKYLTGMNAKYRVFDPGNHITIPAKEQPLVIYSAPVSNAQDKPIYQLNINPAVGDASTLFLCGTIQQPESILITQLPPYHSVADSTLGLRFLNLAPAKTPVRIHISGEGIDKSVTSLGYQSATGYLALNARANVVNVLVEIFDQTTGELLQRYTLQDVGTTVSDQNKWRYRNYTLVWLPNDVNGTLAADPFLIADF